VVGVSIENQIINLNEDFDCEQEMHEETKEREIDDIDEEDYKIAQELHD
jgi:hypothetical protein